MRIYLEEAEAFIWCTYRLFDKLKINVSNVSSTLTQGSRTCSIQDLQLGTQQQKQKKEGVDDRIVQALGMCEQFYDVFNNARFREQYRTLFSSETQNAVININETLQRLQAILEQIACYM